MQEIYYLSTFRKDNGRKYYPQLSSIVHTTQIIENEIIKLGYVPHISYKRKRGYQKKENTYQQRYYSTKNKQWVVKRGQTLDGTTDSGNYLFYVKKSLRTNLD